MPIRVPKVYGRFTCPHNTYNNENITLLAGDYSIGRREWYDKSVAPEGKQCIRRGADGLSPKPRDRFWIRLFIYSYRYAMHQYHVPAATNNSTCPARITK